MAKKYYIVDCISGYHDEEDEAYTSLKEAKTKRDEMNAEREASGASKDFWMVIDSKGNEVE